MTHICVGKPTIIGLDNGLSPDRRQAIIWTNVGILLIGPLGTYFSEISTGIQTFSFKKIHLKLSSAKWRPFCLGLNVLRATWAELGIAYSPTVSNVESHLLMLNALQWCHNECDGISNHQPHNCLLNRLFKAQIKENTKAPCHWPLYREFTSDWWIPRTKDQLRGKYFHLMTSSWLEGDLQQCGLFSDSCVSQLPPVYITVAFFLTYLAAVVIKHTTTWTYHWAQIQKTND